jgi:hypothetical protein
MIDAYHSNTRLSTVAVRKHLAYLDTYMKDLANDNVSKTVCSYKKLAI